MKLSFPGPRRRYTGSPGPWYSRNVSELREFYAANGSNASSTSLTIRPDMGCPQSEQQGGRV